MAEPFGTRLAEAFARRGHLCLGIDPHPYLLEGWGLEDSSAGLREFGLRVVDAAAGRVGMLKPQVAFFERHGSEGYAALEAVLAAAREQGILVIADAKRGDVGSTVEAYGQAWLTPGSPLEADAMTISAFQGVGSIAAPAALAEETGKGLFVLAATSNPESFAPQTAIVMDGENSGRTVSASIVTQVHALNGSASGLGPVGVVLGATVDLAKYDIEASTLLRTPILAPGFGEQGARIADVRKLYGESAGNVLVSVSRSILAAGPDEIGGAIDAANTEIAEAFAR